MSFGTPQRVLNLKRDYERSLRGLENSGSANHDQSYLEDSLDEESSPLRGFHSGYRNGGIKAGRRQQSSLRRGGQNRGIEDKDQIIMDLREEVERLKTKVNTVVESAETSLQEAIESQEALRADCDLKLANMSKQAELASTENIVLKELVEKLQLELEYEREQVSKSMRFMDRIKSSGNHHIHSVLDKNIFKAHVSHY